jgi:hypothetical protein
MADKLKPGVTKKNGEILESGVVIQNINVRPVQRTNLAIDKWRQNHQQAEGINGTRIGLYDMYSDTLLDAFLKRLVAKRVLSVTKNKLKYIGKDGKEIDGADDLLCQRQFRKLRQRIQLYKAWGISVIELMNEKGLLKIFDIPKKHIRPKEGLIISEQYDVDGVNYRMPPYNKTVIEVGDWDDLGYLLEASAYAIYKRGDIADWANYVQIFGMPFREATYDGFNEVVRIQLENALEQAASAAWIVLPEGSSIKLHEPKNAAGSNELYNALRQAMNEEMTVLVIGATETTTSSASSGYAQSQTHQQTVDEMVSDDKEDELSILNEQVVPIMIYLGLLPKGGKFVYDEPMNVDTATKKVTIAKTIKDAGVPVSDEYFYEIAGIPKPDNYDELKQKMEDEKAQAAEAAAANQVPPAAPPDKPAKKAKPLKPGEKKASKLNAFIEDIKTFFATGQ